MGIAMLAAGGTAEAEGGSRVAEEMPAASSGEAGRALRCWQRAAQTKRREAGELQKRCQQHHRAKPKHKQDLVRSLQQEP